MKKIYTLFASIALVGTLSAQTFLSKDFDDLSVTSGGWTNNIVVGTADWYTDEFGGEKFGKVTNYSGGSNSLSEVWLISPSFNLSTSNVPVFTFSTVTNYVGAQLAVYVSTDYNGTSDPTTQGTWTLLNPTLPTSTSSWSAWTPSGNLDLSAYKGSATFVGFKYTGTTSNGKTWELDDVLVVETSTTPPIEVTSSITDASCGSADGAIDVTVSGGITPYTYAWSNGQTTEDLSAVFQSGYSITITDADLTTSVTAFSVNSANGPVATITTVGTTCYDGNDGSATATGGQTGYTYVWHDSSTEMSVSGLSAGTYGYTVTDGAACSSYASFSITSPTVVSISTTGVNESVTGSGNGSASATVGGGSGAGYTYLWSNNATTASISSLTTGVYSITVYDANMCSATSSVSIGADLENASIYEIQYTSVSNGDSPKNGNNVITRGVVTAYSTWDHSSPSRNYRGYFIQDGDSAWSGLFVNDTVNYLSTQPGDTVEVQGTIDEDRYPYWNYTIMKNVTSFTVVSTGGPQATAVQLSTLNANQEKYEGVLVEVNNAIVVDIIDITYGAWSVNDGSGILGVDDIMYGPSTDPALGNKYKVAGVMFSEFNDKTIQPRKPSDVTFLSVGLNEFNKGVAKVFPNPTKGLVSLAITNDLNQASYEVFNIAGSRVEASNITTSQTSIDLTHLTSGVYFLKVKNNNQEFVTKLVKE